MELYDLIKKYDKNLNETDRFILSYIFSNKEKCSTMSIINLAKSCNVSSSTISRLLKKISLENFSELKFLLKNELSHSQLDSNEAIFQLFNIYEKVSNDLKKHDFSAINRLILNSRKVVVCGSGFGQENVVQEFKRIFMASGKLVYDIKISHERFNILQNFTKDDVFIIISLSGQSEHVIRFAQDIKSKNIPLISITTLQENTLATMSDENIYLLSSQLNYFKKMNNLYYNSLVPFFIAAEIIVVNFEKYRRDQTGEEKSLYDN